MTRVKIFHIDHYARREVNVTFKKKKTIITESNSPDNRAHTKF